MKIAKYNVIAKDAKTGTERVLGVISAAGQAEAKKVAVRMFMSEVDMTTEHLMVVRA